MTEALAEYRHKGGVPDKTSTVEFLGAGERGALTDRSGKFRVSLYKVLLYVEIADAIKSGALNLLHSEKYRSLDDSSPSILAPESSSCHLYTGCRWVDLQTPLPAYPAGWIRPRF